MYHRCLQLARYDWSTILCGGRALLPDFRTTAHMWAPLSFSLYILFFVVQSFPSFSMEESFKQFSVITFASVKVDREWAIQPIYTFLPCCNNVAMEKCAELSNS